ncbi:hypothetical protein [Halovivax cerinus]|uniref:Type I restriction enzyme R protein N-terminal domain-containing protein n=1 Tax=Halovivax cerinus TaxID=1487865 RepID=A0ABD5NKX6_9EURY|nr:hypothetical protein [Halovivax cerinus]
MAELELDVYVGRLAEVLESAPPRTRSETAAWVLRPLLAHLGWTVDTFEPAGSIGSVEYDLVAALDTTPPTPALVAACESADTSLSSDRVRALGQAVSRSGIDRAIYTNGRRFVFVVGDGDDHLLLDHEGLLDHERVLGLFSRSAVADHCRDLSAERLRRRRLTVSRAELVSSIESVLAESLGSTPEIDDDALGQFLGGIDTTTDRSAASSEHLLSTDEASSDSPREGSSTAQELVSNESTDGSDSTDVGTDAVELPADVEPETDRRGEFVVRVFNDRGSVGAVGHSTSAGALAEAATYFFERGLRGIRIPWGPDDGPDVLATEPCDASGERWAAYRQLPNDLYVNTEGSVDDRAERVQALAKRAGLRVMLTGDWDA